MKLFALVPAFVVLVSLCGSPVHDPNSTSQPVATNRVARAFMTPLPESTLPNALPRTPPSLPTPYPTPDLSGIRECVASDLSVTWHQEQPYNSFGYADRISFTNESGADCVLDGTADIVLVNEDGTPAVAEVDRYRACFPGLSCPGHEVPILAPAADCQTETPNCSVGAAYFRVSWGSPSQLRDGDKGCDPDPAPLSVAQVVLPNGEAMSLNIRQGGELGMEPREAAMQFAAWCNMVSVSPIWPASQGMAWPTYPVEVRFWPSPGRRQGFTYEVQIVLTNKTNGTLIFDDACPVATLEIALGRPEDADYKYIERQRGTLDCALQSPIPPGQYARFSYTLTVPIDVPGDLRYWNLLWYVGDGSDPRTIVEGGSFAPAFTSTPTPN